MMPLVASRASVSDVLPWSLPLLESDLLGNDSGGGTHNVREDAYLGRVSGTSLGGGACLGEHGAAAREPYVSDVLGGALQGLELVWRYDWHAVRRLLRAGRNGRRAKATTLACCFRLFPGAWGGGRGRGREKDRGQMNEGDDRLRTGIQGRDLPACTIQAVAACNASAQANFH